MVKENKQHTIGMLHTQGACMKELLWQDVSKFLCEFVWGLKSHPLFAILFWHVHRKCTCHYMREEGGKK